MVALIICAVALIAAFGIFNYVIATLKAKGKTIDSKVYSIASIVIVFVISAVVLGFGVLLLRNPQFVFTNLHWGWVLGSGIALCILLVVVGIVWCVKGFQTSVGTTQMVLGLCVLALTIFGICLAPKTTYQVSSAEDLILLSNLPKNDNESYNIEILNDIDFKDITLKEQYGNGNSYIIEGNGHVFRNIDYSVSIDDYSLTFLKIYGTTYVGSRSTSKIKNLSVEDSVFNITPNHYYDDSHEGAACDFYLLSQNVKFESVKINATIHVHDAEENLRYTTKSYVEEIYPTDISDGNNIINIDIIREDK